MRRRAYWSVADFARYTGVPVHTARRVLLRYNDAVGGTLLRPSSGANRRYGFYWALLAQHAPEAFLDNPIEMQDRVDTAERLISDIHESLRSTRSQVGWITREVTRLSARAKESPKRNV